MSPDACTRSAGSRIVEWDQADPPSGIINDPDDRSREHGRPRYIIDLLGRVVTVSLEPRRPIDGLSDLGLADN